MATVIVSAPLPGDALALLGRSGHHVVTGESPYGLGQEGFMRALREAPGAEVLIPLLSDEIGPRVLDLASELRLVANYAVGVNNLDLEEMKKRGVVVTNTPGVLTEATADLTWALLLDACRNVARGDRLVRDGAWRGWSPTLLAGVRVTGATLGIIGCGRIGQAVVERSRGFGMRVLYHQRSRLPEERERELGLELVSLEALLEQSDIVSLHCPLTPETKGLLNEARLRRMKPNAVLINVARGPCVDEGALAVCLRAGHLFAAGLDVYEREPEVHPELIGLPNVVLAPHLGSADLPTRERMAMICAQAALDVLAGREPVHRVV